MTRRLQQLSSSRCLKSSHHASFLKTSLKQNSKLSSSSRTALHQTLCSLLSAQKTSAKREWLDLIKMIQITRLQLFFQRGLEFTMITGSSLCLSSNHRLTWRLLIPNRSSRLPLKSSVVTLSQLLSMWDQVVLPMLRWTLKTLGTLLSMSLAILNLISKYCWEMIRQKTIFCCHNQQRNT